MKNVLVRRSNRDEVSIFDGRDDFMASFRNGHWVDNAIFQESELEDFTIIRDDNEILRLLTEARAALNQPLELQADNQAKSA